MNVAVNNQRDASRRTLSEAYRGQLALLRDRVDAYWALRASDLERETREGSAPAVFERVVKLGLADSAVVMGRAPYPSVTGAIAADPAAIAPVTDGYGARPITTAESASPSFTTRSKTAGAEPSRVSRSRSDARSAQ